MTGTDEGRLNRCVPIAYSIYSNPFNNILKLLYTSISGGPRGTKWRSQPRRVWQWPEPSLLCADGWCCDAKPCAATQLRTAVQRGLDRFPLMGGKAPRAPGGNTTSPGLSLAITLFLRQMLRKPRHVHKWSAITSSSIPLQILVFSEFLFCFFEDCIFMQKDPDIRPWRLIAISNKSVNQV